MPKVTFRSPFRVITTEAVPGTTLLAAALAADAPLGHACGGSGSCSTCHVYVLKGTEALTAPGAREESRLDRAFDVRPNSRLGCQTRVANDDVEVEISDESFETYLDEHPELRKARQESAK